LGQKGETPRVFAHGNPEFVVQLDPLRHEALSEMRLNHATCSAMLDDSRLGTKITSAPICREKAAYCSMMMPPGMPLAILAAALAQKRT